MFSNHGESQVSVVGEGGRVNSKGVVLASGEVLEADAVVCNADLPYAEKALLPDSVSRSFEVFALKSPHPHVLPPFGTHWCTLRLAPVQVMGFDPGSHGK